MEKIWYQDLRGFITDVNYFEFWPSKDMSFAEQLNCLMRFSLYFALIVLLIKKDVNILFVPMFMGIFTYYVYMVDTQNKINEKMILDSMSMHKNERDGSTCVKPSPNNPFMNVLMTDYAKNPKRPSACSPDSKTTRSEIKKHFDKNLFRNVDDVFHKNASDRQFYTTPITTIPNDQNAFAKWLYGQGATCKEGNGDKCFRNMNRGTVGL